MLENLYPNDIKVSTESMIKHFCLEKEGKVLVENLNIEKTRFGRLSSIDKICHFLTGSYEFAYFK